MEDRKHKADFITPEHLRDINAVLREGKDVRIQKTSYGFRIVADTVDLVRKIEVERKA